MIKTRKINCLGATIIGGALLKECGINYLPICLPKHAITILITSDQKIYWLDLLNKSENFEIHDSDFDMNLNDGKKATIQDVINFSRNPSAESLPLKLNPETFRRKVAWTKNPDDNYFEILPPEIGERTMLLWNLGGILISKGKIQEGLEAVLNASKTLSSPPFSLELGQNLYALEKYEECIEYFKKTISKYPNNYLAYALLGNVYRKLEDYENAISVYKQAVKINPKEDEAYNGLGNTFYLQDRADEASEAYRKAIEVNPKSPHPHNGLANVLMETGSHEEAIREYEKFILLADKATDKDLIARASEKIKELEEKISQK